MTFSTPERAPSVTIRTSRFCTDGDCVGVGVDGDHVLVVDTKVDGSTLRLAHHEWATFVAGVKGDELTLP